MKLDAEIEKKLKEKYNPEGSELRNAQIYMCKMMDYLDDICRNEGIDYFLAYGSLLGAVRHKGFIPWDDDIDICIKKEDEKKLIDAVEKSKNPYFVIQSQKTDMYSFSDWCRLRDLRSRYVLKDKNEQRKHSLQKYQGLQIDIFTLEKGVNVKLNYYLCNTRIYNTLLKNNTSAIAKFLSIVLYYARKVMLRMAKMIPGNKHKWALSYGMFPLKNEYPEDMLFPTKEIMFEGKMYRAPRKTHEFLSMRYGDYMSLPDQTVSHGIEKIEMW